MDEMMEYFNPKNINKSASIYNTEKLDWLNSHYIKNTPNNELSRLLEPYGLLLTSHDKIEILLDALKERAKTLKEMAALVYEIISHPTSYDEKAVEKSFKADAIDVLKAFSTKVSACSELHLPSDYHHLMQEVVDEMGIGFGKIGQPLRLALLGKMSGPGLDSVMAIIGKDETISRIDNAIIANS
ncbi:MAG: glutamyl-tRNA synthetase [Campylobacterota bacterium]|nr:glutamyl-tRNA synthetase [Campylobacterota bacterium]